MPTRPLPSLLRRTPLLPGESLESLLLRLAVLNHYSVPGLLFGLIRHARPVHFNDAHWFPREAEVFTVLSELTALPVEQLKQATPHRFTPIFAPGENMVPNGFWASTHLHPRTETQYCPRCLAEAPHPCHRLAWSLQTVTACLSHHCLLHQRCPACGGKLPVAAVVNAVCPVCRADLRRCAAVSLDEPGRLAQQVIQSWFGLVDTPPDVTLPDLPPHSLYKLTLDLAGLLAPVDPAWDFFSPGLTGPHRDTTAAIKSLIDWPASFHALLDACRRRPGRLPSPAITHEFGTLYTHGLEKLWRDLAPVQQAFDDYVRQNGLNLPYIQRIRRYRAGGLPTTFISYAEAMERLNASHNLVARLHYLGLIGRDIEAVKTKRLRILLRRSDVLALQAEWYTPRSTADLSRLLAADEPLVNALLAAGLLPEPTYAAGCGLLDHLQAAVTWPAFRREAIALPDTLDPVASLAAVLAGQVRVYFGGRLGLNYLRLAHGDLINVGLA